MAMINGMRHWPLGTPERLEKSLDLLSKNIQTLPDKFDYRIKIYFIIYDEDSNRFGLPAVRGDDGEYSYPSAMLNEDDADVHSCIVRTCQEELGPLPHAICSPLSVRPLTRSTQGIDYVVFCEEPDLLNRVVDPESIQFVDQTKTAKEFEFSEFPSIEFQKVIALFWNGLKAEISRLAEIIRVAEIERDTDIIVEAQAARQSLLDKEMIVMEQIAAEGQALSSDDEDSQTS